MLTPVGKRRYMEAQSMLEEKRDFVEKISQAMPGPEVPHVDALEGEDNLGMVEPTEQELETEIDQIGNDPVNEVDQEVTQSQDNNLTQIIFKFLEKQGYPPRRLNEFKSKFFTEKGTRDDTRVELKIPDEVYGTGQPISKDDFKALKGSIEKHTGLSFLDYNRADSTMTMNFSSNDPRSEEMAMQTSDVLDQVYGSPGSKKKRTQAYSLQELIKLGKSKQMDTIKKILGENK